MLLKFAERYYIEFDNFPPNFFPFFKSWNRLWADMKGEQEVWCSFEIFAINQTLFVYLQIRMINKIFVQVTKTSYNYRTEIIYMEHSL